MVNRAPGSRTAGPSGERAEADLGPLQVDEDARRRARPRRRAYRTLVTRSWSAYDPCERFMRATSMPASMRERMPPGSRQRPEGADDLGAAHRMTTSGFGEWSRRPRGWVVDPPARTRSGQVEQLARRAVGGIGVGRLVEPTSQRSTADAAERPSAMAQTMSDWPRPASPAGRRRARWSCSRGGGRCRGRRARRRAGRAARRAPGR